MTSEPMDGPLWTPSPERAEAANMTAFMRMLAERGLLDDGAGGPARDYDSLWRWSVENPGPFWDAVWSFCGVVGERGSGPVVDDADKMPGAHWFEGARLNVAETLLRRTGAEDAVVFWGEDQVRRRLSWDGLRGQVAALAAVLRDSGVEPGDRVAGYLPNMPEAIIGMLASASIGAVWSSASPDFGVRGVLDRFGQIAPKVLIACDGYFYNGKLCQTLPRLAEIVDALEGVARTIVVPYAGKADALEGVRGAVAWDEALDVHKGAALSFLPLPFDHPLYILYSSGTTGAPKCIVHGAGGALLQHLKEHRLHCDIRPGDRVFYFTTCGWMMWNWLASALGSGATVLLYDGSPFHPSGNILFDYAEEEGMTFLGTSAKFIDAARKAGLEPRRGRSLEALRAVASTGSPLSPEGFDWVYDKVKADLHLASISGGTDIVSCFMLGNPIAPVWRGEIQCRGLGMKVEVYDDEGRPVVGEKGELVCTRAFPSMPVGFWNDPEGEKYRAAYFERFPGVWTHGDWVELTPRGGIVVHGRSDATLNPGGVRIGTAEIYRQVETVDAVLESLVVGQDWQGDVRVVLFVRLREDAVLDDALKDTIRKRIRANCTPRHVPALIIQVDDIPRTKSGKLVELAVRDVIHGRPVKNREALANPEALEQFRALPELKA